MHGHGGRALQKAAGHGGLPAVHGVVSARGQQGDVDAEELAPEGHVAEDAGVAGVVGRQAVGQLDDVAAGAGRFARVEGLGHGDGGALAGDGAADVESAAYDLLGRNALGLQLAGSAHDGAEAGAGAFADFDGAANVVAVIVRDKHQVDAVLDGCLLHGGVGKEGIDENADVGVLEAEGRVSVPGDAAHACGPRCKREGRMEKACRHDSRTCGKGKSRLRTAGSGRLQQARPRRAS